MKIENVTQTLKENKPEILTTMGCIGVVSTASLAIQATPIANERMELVKKQRTKKDKALLFCKSVLPCYIPTIVSGVASITCIVLSHKELTNRNMITAGIAAASERTLKQYQQKVIDKIGETKEAEVRDELAKDKLVANPMNGNNIIVTGKNEHWIYDTYSGRYFKCDIESVRSAVNTMNEQVNEEMRATLNDFYYIVNIPPIKHGDDVGWSSYTGYMKTMYSAQLNENNEPCIVIDYDVHELF